MKRPALSLFILLLVSTAVWAQSWKRIAAPLAPLGFEPDCEE